MDYTTYGYIAGYVIGVLIALLFIKLVGTLADRFSLSAAKVIIRNSPGFNSEDDTELLRQTLLGVTFVELFFISMMFSGR